MDEEVKKRVNTVLARMHKDYDGLPTTTKKELDKVVQTIDTMVSEYNIHKDCLKETVVNVSNVAKRSRIARKTFYNNTILNGYVEHCSAATKEPDTNADALAKCRELNRKLTCRIDEFLSSTGINSEKLRCDYDDLLESFVSLQKQYNDLREKYDTVVAERDAMKQDAAITDASKLN